MSRATTSRQPTQPGLGADGAKSNDVARTKILLLGMRRCVPQSVRQGVPCGTEECVREPPAARRPGTQPGTCFLTSNPQERKDFNPTSPVQQSTSSGDPVPRDDYAIDQAPLRVRLYFSKSSTPSLTPSRCSSQHSHSAGNMGLSRRRYAGDSRCTPCPVLDGDLRHRHPGESHLPTSCRRSYGSHAGSLHIRSPRVRGPGSWRSILHTRLRTRLAQSPADLLVDMSGDKARLTLASYAARISTSNLYRSWLTS